MIDVGGGGVEGYGCRWRIGKDVVECDWPEGRSRNGRAVV